METAEDKALRFRLVGSFLKSKRVAAGLTQRHIADALDYSSPQFVSNWERGLSLPPLEALPILTRLYGIPSHAMLQVMNQYQEEIVRSRQKTIESILCRSQV